MRIILFGKAGQVGGELQHLLPKLGEVIALGRTELDVSDTQAIQNLILELKPQIIINASAYTDVDLAEKEPKLAMQVNAYAPAAMAETARRLQSVLIHYSTDYVFDGKLNKPYREQDDTNPLNEYGRSKLAGEQYIEQVGNAYLILRTSWVYSLYGNNFLNKVLEWARKNKTLKIVKDQISNPTWSRALAETTSHLLSSYGGNLFDVFNQEHGIYHLAGNGYTSRYEWAKQIIAYASNQTDLIVETIEPVASEEFPMLATRPLFSALDCSKFKEQFHLSLPDWNETLQAAMSK